MKYANADPSVVRSIKQRGELKRDDFRINRHRALASNLGMISPQTLRVCREGKPKVCG
jgi:hypothetical protein